MATVNVTNTQSFISGETVTPAKLNTLGVPNVAISNIVNADVSASAAIAASKLALTGAIGSSQLATTSITGQTAIDSLANADTLLIHDDSTSALRKVTWSQIVAAAQPVGSVVKTEYAQLVGVQSYTSGQTLAAGATPTITSGVEILAINSLSTASASNYLVITANALISTSTAPSVILMLFAGNTLVATANIVGSNSASIMTLVYKHSPASTSAVNYTVRAACEAGTLYVNRLYTVTDYNTGKQVSSMLIQEIKA
jgi:hypothetical protein